MKEKKPYSKQHFRNIDDSYVAEISTDKFSPV